MPKNKKNKKRTNNHNITKEVAGSKIPIRPMQDRVLIRETEDSGAEKKTASGIIIPVTVNEDKGSKRGEVVAVGHGRTEDGRHVPMSVKVGDTVLFQWGDKVKIGDNEYYVVRESEILVIIK